MTRTAGISPAVMRTLQHSATPAASIPAITLTLLCNRAWMVGNRAASEDNRVAASGRRGRSRPCHSCRAHAVSASPSSLRRRTSIGTIPAVGGHNSGRMSFDGERPGTDRTGADRIVRSHSYGERHGKSRSAGKLRLDREDLDRFIEDRKSARLTRALSHVAGRELSRGRLTSWRRSGPCAGRGRPPARTPASPAACSTTCAGAPCGTSSARACRARWR